MRYSGCLATLSLLLIPLLAIAQEREVPRTFDHTIYVQIETTPAGADLHAISAQEQKITRKLGISPCTTAIGLKWGDRFNRRNWRALTVWCPGDACRATYNKKEKTYDLTFTCAAVKKGYQAKRNEVKIATLSAPSYGWDIPDTWPNQIIVEVSLQKKKDEARALKKAQRIPKIILANNPDDLALDLGTLEIRCDVPDAYVYIDKKRVQKTPINVMIPVGWHRVEIRSDTHSPYSVEVNIAPNQTKKINARLAPR